MIPSRQTRDGYHPCDVTLGVRPGPCHDAEARHILWDRIPTSPREQLDPANRIRTSAAYSSVRACHRTSFASRLRRSHGERLDSDERRRAPGRHFVYAGRRQAWERNFPPFSSTTPIAKTTARPRVTTRSTPTSPAAATSAPAWIFAASAAAKAFPPTASIPNRSSLTDCRSSPGWRHQTWSNGNVGMMGISWSGFNSMQMAMRHPPELKAIIAVDATAELFHDDVHYMDGMAHIDEFELNMDMAPGMTGAPDYTLDEKVLGPRFDAAPWSLLYLKHQHDGPFWRSPVRPLSEIKVPSFLIGGLQDGYRDSIPDMLMQTKAPIKAIVGPWNHTYPPRCRLWPANRVARGSGALVGLLAQGPRHRRVAGSAAGDLHAALASARSESVERFPENGGGKTAGRRRKPRTRLFSCKTIIRWRIRPRRKPAHQLKYVPSVGVEAGFWWGELLSDVRPVDAFSLVYDSAPLTRRLGNSGQAARLPAGFGHGAFGRLVCATLGCRSRRHRHPDHRGRNERCAARFYERPS